MSKLEIIKLTAELYPCPDYYGVKIKTNFITTNMDPRIRLIYSSDVYIKNDIKVFIHMVRWVKNLTTFIGISEYQIKIDG